MIGLATGIQGVSLAADTKKYTAFSGKRSGWYFTLMDGAIAQGWRGPFANQEDCERNRAGSSQQQPSACYERETVEYYQWRTNQTRLWVLPIRTGAQSARLVFGRKEDCLRVARSDFYYGETDADPVKIPKRSEFRHCLVDKVWFDEVAQRYRHVDRHAETQTALPQKFKAWSFPVDEGHYVKLLQFRNQAACERVARDKKFYEFIPRTGFGSMRIAYPIPSELARCVRRVPKRNEIPVLYQHIGEHEGASSAKKSQASASSGSTLWVLAVQKSGGVMPLYFKTREDCRRLERDGYYFREIDRGFLPSTYLRMPIETIAQECTLAQLPIDVKTRVYPHFSKHEER